MKNDGKNNNNNNNKWQYLSYDVEHASVFLPNTENWVECSLECSEIEVIALNALLVGLKKKETVQPQRIEWNETNPVIYLCLS